MIKIKLKSKLKEAGPSDNIQQNDFGVYANTGDVVDYILVDMNALKQLVSKSGSAIPISSKLLTPDALFDAGVVAGGLELKKASKELYGPCLDSYAVKASSLSEKFTGKGLGKELYKLAMGHLGHPLIPDRSNVSEPAQRVWASLERDGTVKKDFDMEYYGDSDTPKKFKISKLDTNDETPPPGDDCLPTKTKNAPEFLNRAYNTNQFASRSKQLANKLSAYVKKNIAEPSAFYESLIETNFKLFVSRF
jgi:hypothetical protein